LIRVSSWLTRCEASALQSSLFQAINRLNPADKEPALYAVNKAINKTLTAVSIGGDQKAGVVWHTQGSGKSLSMVFYTGKIVLAASALQSSLFQAINRLNPADKEPALASKPSEITNKAL
jgi:hypothetical protein